MSMMDVARYLSYSKSVDLAPQGERFFNLSMVNTNHLFSCLYGDARHWGHGRQGEKVMEQSLVRERKG